jgi:hypothetical protein
LAELTKAYRSSPEQQLRRAEERAGAMGNDTAGRVQADLEIARLRKGVERASADPTQAVHQSQGQRISNAIEGVVDHNGAEVAAGSQIPARDFSGQIQDDLALGIRAELTKAFYETGKSDDPEGHNAAAEWFRRYNSNSNWQTRHAADDPEICRWFRTACIYAAGTHEPR